MALSNNDVTILQEVVNTNGKCLDSKRCMMCPFRGMCLPEFAHPNPPTQPQRLKMAVDVLTNHALIEHELISSDEVQKDYKWEK